MKILRLLLVFILGMAVFYSCKKKADDELSEEIHNIVPDSILTKMESMGMPIFGGTTPPDFQNIYLASPYVLKKSTISSDVEGHTFSDYYVRFYDQDNDLLSVKLDYDNGPENGSGLGGYIAGTNNSFSAFVKVNSTYNGDQAEIIHVISGTIIEGAIKNFYFANFMLDNKGNPHGYWIDEGQGRIIYDSDGNSPVVSAMPSKGGLGTTVSTVIAK